jgi:hypothetical protein
MSSSERLHGRAESVADVGAAVVGHYSLDPADALLAKPRGCASEERRGRTLLFVREQLRITRARVVVDRNVKKLPPEARLAIALASLSRYQPPGCATAPNPSELLDVEMQQLPRASAFVPDDGVRRVQPAQPIEPEAALHEHNRRERELEMLGDVQRTAPLLPELQDLATLGARQRTGRPARPTRAIDQSGLTFYAIPSDPLPDGALTHAHAPSHPRRRFLFLNYTADKHCSPGRGQSCILVAVH